MTKPQQKQRMEIQIDGLSILRTMLEGTCMV
jgi:hypothetical protein